jgi:uncharacterized membrane protein YfcA
MTLILGLIVGVLFGLTGNGGSTLAVPLLVYALHLRPHAAVCTSMIAVGAMAGVRAIQTTRGRGIDKRLGWQLAFGGLAGAPVGALIGRHLPERWLLLVFAALVLIVAIRLWIQQSNATPNSSGQACENSGARTHQFFRLVSLGFGTGVLSGLLGVGGGFILVPGLVLIGRVEIHRAIATAMFSVALVSAAATGAHFLTGQQVSWETTGLFTLGGMIGLWPGTWLAARLSGLWLTRVLATGLLLLGAFIVVHSLLRN